MKKNKLIIVLVIMLLLMTGCNDKNKSSLEQELNKNSESSSISGTSTDSNTTTDSTEKKDIDTSGSGKLKCTRDAKAGSNVTVDLNYEIQYKNGNIQVLHSVEEVTSTSSERLDEYEMAYKKIALNYEGLKYYDTNVKRTSNKVINDTTIHYDKIDIEKLLEIEGEEDNVIVNGKAKLSKWLEFAKRFGTKCEEVK